MFYSHEILTSRKYGVATVWLVATLGAKSNTRKVTRKAILDVDVRKACETVMEPHAPLALRLQSNLLFGISRVYSQQCGYVLTDAQAAQNAIRGLLRIARDGELDPEAGKARSDQLMIQDDPAFLPDSALPALDFDLSNLLLGNSQLSSQSMMSIKGRGGSVVSHEGSVIGLNLSSSNFGQYQLPLNDPFGAADSSVRKLMSAAGAGPGRELFADDGEEDYFRDDEILFEFDDDGQIRDIPLSERAARRASSLHPSHRPGSDSAASGRVRKEHEDAANRVMLGREDLDGEGDFNMFNYGEDEINILQDDAVPFPVMTGGLGGNDRPLYHRQVSDHVFSASSTSEESAAAPARQKKAKAPRIISVDQALELRNNDLLLWQREYPHRMTGETLVKANRKEAAHAKKNAFDFVVGNGINGVGAGIGSSRLPSALAIFSGDALLECITGRSASSSSSLDIKKNSKRPRSATGDEMEAKVTPNKRLRETENGRGGAQQPYEEDGFLPMADDYDGSARSVEVGREAPSALADYPSSAMMPWNVSASLHSHQRGQSSSAQRGRAGILGSQLGSATARRLTSASPLVGRGSNFPGDLEHFSMLDDPIQYGRSDSLEPSQSQHQGPGFPQQISSSQRGGFALGGGAIDENEFEIFGQAAGVDTQTAGTSQWVRETMDRESGNFFEYVKNSIVEKLGDELNQEDGGVLDAAALGGGFVTFEELFKPERNSQIVAAQAFYHVLSLATKRAVTVEQDADEEMVTIGGEIRIRVA